LVPKPLHAPSCNHSNVADDTYKGLRLALSWYMLAGSYKWEQKMLAVEGIPESVL
jgi:hypothetical protein